VSTFKTVFEQLAGEWKLSRHISSGEIFSGIACFEKASPSEFLLSESGELKTQDGNSITASREWCWTYTPVNQLTISYNENPLRLYHQLSMGIENEIWTGEATHLCIPDTYFGQYEFSEDQIRIEQKISGPKKNYIVSSLFERY